MNWKKTRFFRAKLQWSRKNGKKKNENRKMKTPVYDGEGGKISPSCPIWESTLGFSILLEKAALRHRILPAVLRELFLTGCVLKLVVLAHCEETLFWIFLFSFFYTEAANVRIGWWCFEFKYPWRLPTWRPKILLTACQNLWHACVDLRYRWLTMEIIINNQF